MRTSEAEQTAGFGAIGSILIIIVIILIGVIGWRIYDTEKTTSTSPTSSPQPPPQPPATYLDIKELGVKIKLDDSVKDAIYTVKSGSDGSQTAYFSTKSLTLVDPACGPNDVALAALSKSKMDTDQFGRKLVVNNHSVFKFGDYYFTSSGPQAACSDKDQPAQSEAVKALLRSLTTLQPDR